MIIFDLKFLLAMQGITQKELSERTGIRLPTISDLCTGKIKHIPVQVLEKICDALDCQPGDILSFRRGTSDQDN